MKKDKPLRKAAETPIAPPPTPVDEGRRIRRSTQRTKFAPQDDCRCCDGSHSDNREEAETACHYLLVSSCAHRQLEEPQRAQPYASWSEFDKDLKSGGYYAKVYGGGASTAGISAKAGSSVDLPLAADEPGSVDYNLEDDPRVDTGETHQTATHDDLDLLGSHEGEYTLRTYLAAL